MKCSFFVYGEGPDKCDRSTQMTARDSKGNLYNCCYRCKRKKQLNVSTIMKENCNFDPKKKERRD
jgi:hypothetical protein